MAAYSVFLPVATLGATLRISAVRELADHDGRGTAHLGVAGFDHLALTVAATSILVAPGAAALATASLPSSTYAYALLTWLMLTCSGAAQIAAAGRSALMAGRGQLARSTALYAACGLIGLVVSAVAIMRLGAVGAAVGVLVSALLVLLAHQRGSSIPLSVRVAPWGAQQRRTLFRGARSAAIPATVQLHFIAAVAFAPQSPGAVTGMTYAFLFLSLTASASFQVLGTVGLGVVARAAPETRTIRVRETFEAGFPVALCLAGSVGVLCATGGRMLAESLPSAVFDPVLVGAVFDYLPLLLLTLIPWGAQTMLFPLAVSLGREREALRAAVPTFPAVLAVLVAFGESSPIGLAVSLLAAEAVYAVTMARQVLDRPGAVAVSAAVSGSPIIVVGIIVVHLGSSDSALASAAVSLVACAGLAVGLRGAQGFDRRIADLNREESPEL